MSKFTKWVIGILGFFLVTGLIFAGYQYYRDYQARTAFEREVSKMQSEDSSNNAYSTSSETGQAYENGKAISKDLTVGKPANMKFAKVVLDDAIIKTDTDGNSKTQISASWQAKKNKTEFRTDYFQAFDKDGEQLDPLLMSDETGQSMEDTGEKGVKKNTVIKGDLAFDGVATKIVYSPSNIMDGVRPDKAVWKLNS